MEHPTCVYAEEHVDRYKEDPIVAAHKLAAVWCENPTEQVDVWGCDWPCKEFFRTFLDVCREKGRLKEALGIWWIVHNCPGPETEPCHHNSVCQQVIDYSKEHGLESCTEWLIPHGMDKFQNFVDIAGSKFSWWSMLWADKEDQVHKATRRFVSVYPNPKDENGRFVPLLCDKRTGETTAWPRDSDGMFLTVDQLDEQGI